MPFVPRRLSLALLLSLLAVTQPVVAAPLGPTRAEIGIDAPGWLPESHAIWTQVETVLRHRLAEMGLQDSRLQRLAKDRLSVDLDGLTDSGEVLTLLATPGRWRILRWVGPGVPQDRSATGWAPTGIEDGDVRCDKPGRFVAFVLNQPITFSAVAKRRLTDLRLRDPQIRLGLFLDDHQMVNFVLASAPESLDDWSVDDSIPHETEYITLPNGSMAERWHYTELGHGDRVEVAAARRWYRMKPLPAPVRILTTSHRT